MTRFLMALILALIPTISKAQTRDVCTLISRNPAWQSDLQTVEAKWQVTPGTVLAVLDQESRFNPNARGAGAGGANPSSNFGFAQANLRTWNWFLRDTGRRAGSRSDFALSADFVGWHFATMERRIGTARSNISAHYLAYKMGEGGYKRGASARSRTLADQISARARRFDEQLVGC